MISFVGSNSTSQPDDDPSPSQAGGAGALSRTSAKMWHKMAAFGAWFKTRLRCFAIRRFAKAHAFSE
jgi:hypothetical protein